MMSQEDKTSMENILRDLGHKIDELIVQAKSAKDEVRDDIEEKIKVLKSKKELLEKEYYNFRHKHQDKWEEVRNHLASAAEEIKLAAEAVFRKNQ